MKRATITLTLTEKDVDAFVLAIGHSYNWMMTADDDDLYLKDIKRLAKLAVKLRKSTNASSSDMEDLIENFTGGAK